MFSRILTQKSMMTYSEQIEQVRQALHEADGIPKETDVSDLS